MDDEFELEYSKHCGHLERDGRSIDVEIYRGKEEENETWILEIVDAQTNDSIVWTEEFETDTEAYNFLLQAIENEGLGSLIDSAPEARLPE